MLSRLGRLAACCVGLFLAGPASAQTAIPSRTAWIIDQTATLGAPTIAKVDADLARYAGSSRNQVAVLLVPGTGDEALEAYAARVVETWKLGGPERRGVVLVWSAEGYIAMGVGSGLADQLPLTVQTQIEQAWIIPRFGNDDADGGIAEGAEHIVRVLQGQKVTDDDDPAAQAVAMAQLALASAEGNAPAKEASSDASSEEDPDTTSDGESESEEGNTDDTDAPDASEEPVSPDAEIETEPMSPLMEERIDDLARIAAGFGQSPGNTLSAVLHESQGQWSQLPDALDALWFPAKAIPEEVDVARYVLLGLALLAGIAAWRRRPRFAALVVGVPLAVALWIATGFTALCLTLPVFSLVFVMLLPLLTPLAREMLRRPQDDDEDDERRKREAILAVTSKRVPAPGRNRTVAGTPTTNRASASVPCPVAPPPQAPVAIGPCPSWLKDALTPVEWAGLQKRPDLLQLAQKLEQWRPALARMKPLHVVIAVVVLFGIHPVFGVLGALAGVALLALGRSGAALQAVVVAMVRAGLRSK